MKRSRNASARSRLGTCRVQGTQRGEETSKGTGTYEKDANVTPGLRPYTWSQSLSCCVQRFMHGSRAYVHGSVYKEPDGAEDEAASSAGDGRPSLEMMVTSYW